MSSHVMSQGSGEGEIHFDCDADGCGEHDFFCFDEGELNMANLEAKEMGWTFKREAGDFVPYCPDCSENKTTPDLEAVLDIL